MFADSVLHVRVVAVMSHIVEVVFVTHFRDVAVDAGAGFRVLKQLSGEGQQRVVVVVDIGLIELAQSVGSIAHGEREH